MTASRHLVLSFLSFYFFAALLLLQISSCSSYIVGGGDLGREIDGGSRKLGQKPGIDCAGLCVVRCEGNSNHKACIRTCGTCCFRCGCVPRGRYASRNMCGACYANMTTHHNELKCP